MITQYEKVATEYAEKTIIDETEKRAFINGVKRTVNTLILSMNNYSHPMCNASENAHLKELTWSDLKKVLKELSEEI